MYTTQCNAFNIKHTLYGKRAQIAITFSKCSRIINKPIVRLCCCVFVYGCVSFVVVGWVVYLWYARRNRSPPRLRRRRRRRKNTPHRIGRRRGWRRTNVCVSAVNGVILVQRMSSYSRVHFCVQIMFGSSPRTCRPNASR